MKINNIIHYENLNGFWRRRRYQRLNAANNKKQQKLTLGATSCSQNSCTKTLWNVRTVFPKFQLRNLSPFELLSKFNKAYVRMMHRLSGEAVNLNRANFFNGEKIGVPSYPGIALSCSLQTYYCAQN